MTMTVFELTLAIAIGAFVALLLNQLVGILIAQSLQREKDKEMQKLFQDLNEGLDALIVKKKNEQNSQKEEKDVDNNPFE